MYLYMSHYNCYRCGYITIRRSDMRLHLNRKNICKPIIRDINIDDYRQNILNKEKIDETRNPNILSQNIPKYPKISQNDNFECQYCERSYKHSFHLNRHVKICKNKKEQDEATAKTYELVDKLNRRLEEQNQIINNFENIKYNNNIQINNNISTSINNVQININVDKNRLSYKDTNYNILDDSDIRQSIDHAGRCLHEIIPRTHFNPNHPENQNIYISCLKSAVAMMFEGERWNAHIWEDVAERFIDDNVITLQEWMETNKIQYPHLVEKFKIFLLKKENDDGYKFMSKLKREIKMILYNHRKMIHSDEMVTLLQSLENA